MPTDLPAEPTPKAANVDPHKPRPTSGPVNPDKLPVDAGKHDKAR